jgi:hypothetical protein
MIKLLHEGDYTLIETKGQTKILKLDTDVFAWAFVEHIGEILISTYKKHWIDHVLAIGPYRLYKVKDEPEFVDMLHLELFVGEGQWQGYLLPTGLPHPGKRRSSIIPTREIITKSSRLGSFI